MSLKTALKIQAWEQLLATTFAENLPLVLYDPAFYPFQAYSQDKYMHF